LTSISIISNHISGILVIITFTLLRLDSEFLKGLWHTSLARPLSPNYQGEIILTLITNHSLNHNHNNNNSHNHTNIPSSNNLIISTYTSRIIISSNKYSSILTFLSNMILIISPCDQTYNIIIIYHNYIIIYYHTLNYFTFYNDQY
jgi:hypothetical protein